MNPGLLTIDLGHEVKARRGAKEYLYLDHCRLSLTAGHDLNILGPEENEHRSGAGGGLRDGKGISEPDETVADR